MSSPTARCPGSGLFDVVGVLIICGLMFCGLMFCVLKNFLAAARAVGPGGMRCLRRCGDPIVKRRQRSVFKGDDLAVMADDHGAGAVGGRCGDVDGLVEEPGDAHGGVGEFGWDGVAVPCRGWQIRTVTP